MIRRNSARQPRVPNDAKYMLDIICNVDTNCMLVLLGLWKVVLLVALMVATAMLMVSAIEPTQVNSIEFARGPQLDQDTMKFPSAQSIQQPGQNQEQPQQATFKGDFNWSRSIAPWVVMLALTVSIALDWVTTKHRTHLVLFSYVIISTLSVVSCVLFIEYDRVLYMKFYHNSAPATFWFDDRNYFIASVFSTLSVITLAFTIYVGTQMAALEEQRLFNERLGMAGMLKRRQHKLPWLLSILAKAFSCLEGLDSNVKVAAASNNNMTYSSFSVNLDSDQKRSSISALS